MPKESSNNVKHPRPIQYPMDKKTPRIPTPQPTMDEEAHYYIIAHGRCSASRTEIPNKENTVIIFYAEKGQSIYNKEKGLTWEANAASMFHRLKKNEDLDSREIVGYGQKYHDMVFSNDGNLQNMGVFTKDGGEPIIPIAPATPDEPGILLSTIIDILNRNRSEAPIPLNTRTNIIHVISCRGIKGQKSTRVEFGGKKKSRRKRKRRYTR